MLPRLPSPRESLAYIKGFQLLKKKEKKKTHFNLEFSKVILPWNPFAPSIHHSLKEDWCSSARSLGTSCLPAQVPQPLGWALRLSSFTSSYALCQPFAPATPRCSCFLQHTRVFLPACLYTSCSLPEPAMLFPPPLLLEVVLLKCLLFRK